MKENFATCLLTGKNFSPKRFSEKTKVLYDDSNEKGEVDKRTGLKLDRGAAIINEGYNIHKNELDLNLSDLLDFLVKNKNSLLECGVENIYVTLVLGHDGKPSAWHIEYENLKKLVELGTGLSLDLYQAGDKEEYEEDVAERGEDQE